MPHWLYPLNLRSHGRVWALSVIWASILGVFLTSIGLYLGIVQFSRRGTRALSPYSGIWYWHHTAGLLFGAFALTWLFERTLFYESLGASREPGSQPPSCGRSADDLEGRADSFARRALAS